MGGPSVTHAVTRALFGRAGDAVAREQAREGHAEGPGRAELGGRAGRVFYWVGGVHGFSFLLAGSAGLLHWETWG